PNSADSSARVFSPESDAIATRALNSALCCFLFTPTSHVLWTGQPLAYPAVQKSGAAAYYARQFPHRTHVLRTFRWPLPAPIGMIWPIERTSPSIASAGPPAQLVSMAARF